MLVTLVSSGCLETKSNKLVGKWEANIPNEIGNSITTAFTFNNDGTGIWVHPLLGKLYFKYRISDNKIILSDMEPCTENGLWSCKGEASISYQFYTDDTLFLTIGGVKVAFEKKWI